MRKLKRRVILRAAGIGLVAFGGGGMPPFLARLVSRADAAGITGRRRTLVTIFQRGAMDGIMAVAPLGDPGLAKLRPGLALPERGEGALLDLGNGFGLHPAFAPLVPHWRDGTLAIVHGVGSPDPTRSHFDAQDFMETGTPGRKGTPSGWLNRAASMLPGEAGSFRALSMTAALPRSLAGEEPVLAVADLEQFRLLGRRRLPTGATTANGFESLYEQTSSELLRGTGRESFDAIETVRRLDVSGYRPDHGAEYPASKLGRALRQIALLVKSDVGLEIAFAESDGWDTHVRQGAGVFANRASDLAEAIAAFRADLGPRGDDDVLMTMTEFGRTLHENGSGGTDHGRGSCLFVLGSEVRGGKVHGTLPRLREDELEDGRDLPVTTDFRAVFAGVAGPHLGLGDDDLLFPGWSGARAPLIG